MLLLVAVFLLLVPITGWSTTSAELTEPPRGIPTFSCGPPILRTFLGIPREEVGALERKEFVPQPCVPRARRRSLIGMIVLVVGALLIGGARRTRHADIDGA